jgi:hypothetical protein
MTDARRTKAPTEEPRVISKGSILESRVGRLYAYFGYFVRLNRTISTEGRLNRATDLDVFAVRYVPPFKRQTQIVECKSGGRRPLDRIFWLSGVRQHAKADAATLVSDTTKWDIKDFARLNGVELIDRARVDEFEAVSGLTDLGYPAYLDPDALRLLRPGLDRITKSSRENRELIDFLEAEITYDRPITPIRFLLFHMRRLTREAGGKETRTAVQSLLVDCFAQLTMFLLRFAEITVGQHKRDVDALVYRELKYGTIDQKVVDRMLRWSETLTEQVVHSMGIPPSRINRDLFKAPEPSQVSETQELVRLVRDNPINSVSLPQLIDYVLGNRFITGKAELHWVRVGVFGTRGRQLVSLLSDIAQIVSSLRAIPNEFVEYIAQLSSASVPTTAAAEIDSVHRNKQESRAEEESIDKPSLFSMIDSNESSSP